MTLLIHPSRSLRSRLASLCGILLLLSFAAQGRAAENDENGFEVALHAGPLLPSRIAYVREIVQGWGARVSVPTAKGIFELENFHARGDGIVYNTVSMDYRLDIKNDYLPTHFLLGFHGDYFHGPNRDWVPAGGWHFGGGVSEKIAGPVFFRTDFKYRFSPGTSLYVGVGITYRFSSGGGNQGP
jgi:hypothetical protein